MEINFRDWLSIWLLYFYKEDGIQGVRLPKFVGTLWSIWICRNEQIFHNRRPTMQSIRLQLQLNASQHDIFSTPPRAQTSSPHTIELDLPPGFHCAHIGRTNHGPPPIPVQIDGSWDRVTHMGGTAWVVAATRINSQQGKFCYATSALGTEAAACLMAIAWAKEANHMDVVVLTDSSMLVQLLRSEGRRDIHSKWTIQQILHLANSFNTCKVIKVHRNQVQQAHQLAQWCRQHHMDYG